MEHRNNQKKASPIRLYQEAMEADRAFTDQVIRQFGERAADTMRYRSALFDPQTRVAHKRYLAAIERWLAHLRRSEKESSF